MTELYGIDYGGPACGLVHQDRLVLAGSIGVPDLVVASRLGEWQDFGLTRPVDGVDVATEADGFYFEQSTSGGNPFHAMLQQEGLFLFGSGGEAAVPPGPFTPGQAQIRENSTFGAEPGIAPLLVSGIVVFAQAGGQDVRAIAWSEQQRRYEVPSLLADAPAELLVRAEAMAGRESDGGRAPTIYVVQEDGRTLVRSLPTARPSGWCEWETGARYRTDRSGSEPERVLEGRARFVDVETSGQDVVFLVERGGEVRLERLAEETEPGAPAADLPEDLSARALDALGAGAPERSIDLSERRELTLWAAGRVADDGTGAEWQEHEVPAGALFLRRVAGEWRWLTATDEDPTDFREAALVRFGVRYSTCVETVPALRPTPGGVRGSVMKSRIFDCVCTWDGPAPVQVEVNLYAQPESEWLPGFEPHPVRYSSFGGWRRRSTVRLDFGWQVTLTAIGYRVAG